MRLSIDSADNIVITLGIDNEYPNKYDHDLKVELSDGKESYYFYIVDLKDYPNYPPCYPDVPKRDERRVSCGTEVPTIFKFTVILLDKAGYCETPQEGGYFNVGKFEKYLEHSTLLDLNLYRDDADENYYIRYISIQTANSM